MAGGNLSPRQKMIGMMYLVLTALLALNVSKDILDAFILVNTSLEGSVDNANSKNESLYAEFNKAKVFDAKKVTPYWKKAQEIKKASLELVNHINELKIKLIQETEKIAKEQADTLKLRDVNNKDNYDIPTYILIGEKEDGSKGLARELKNKIKAYKENILNLFNEKERKTVQIELNTNDVKTDMGMESWEMNNFYHTPLAAAITILSKIQTDIKNTEYDVVNKLLQSITKNDYNFDTVAAKIIPSSNYVLLGEKYQADVFVAAFSSTQNPEILIVEYDSTQNKLINIFDTVPVFKGLGNYSVETNKEGIFNYSGVIRMKSPDGNTVKEYPFQSEYIVARPSLVVSPDKMNVFYIGPKNPVSISVPGVPSENIKVTITGAGNSINKIANGKYEVKLSNGSPRNVNVQVSAVMANGEIKSMGAMPFDVRKLPKPYAEVGTVSTSRGKELLAQIKVFSSIKAKYDPSFVFGGLNLNIVKYRLEVWRGISPIYEKDRYNGEIKQEDKEFFKSLRRKDVIYFTKVAAQDVSGQRIPLNDVTIEVR
jgi:gliding motility-associated protein GldM